MSTIWFVSYESYLSTGRDTAKISLVKDINTSFGTYWLKSRIPLPENKVDITASWAVFAYQWDFTKQIADVVWFKWDPYDDNLDVYPTYMLSLNQKDTQILHYLEDPQTLEAKTILETYAFTDYQILYPKVIWKALGIMIDEETQKPLHLIESVASAGDYDVINGTGSLRAYYSDREYFEGEMGEIIPDKSCLRILELWNSKWDVVYTINPTGTKKVRVYCDMRTEWWGWTIIVNNDNKDDEYITTSANSCYPRLSWDPSHSCGWISESQDFVVNANNLKFTELVWWVYEWKFNNIKTYRYLKWNSNQIIPNSTPYQIPEADDDTKTLALYPNTSLIYCWSSDAGAAYIETGSPNNSFPHNPVTIIGRTSYDNGKISFTDAYSDNGTDHSSYGFDDFQDGQSCSDNYSDETYKWYSSYIMIR